MKLTRFQQLLDSRGGDLLRWPEEDRNAAEDLLARDPQAAGALARARRLDLLIDKGFSAEVSDDRADAAAFRVLARLPNISRMPLRSQNPQRASSVVRGVALAWPAITVLTLAASLGIAVGIFAAESQALHDQRLFGAVSDDPDADLNAVLFDVESARSAS
jgi:hypothetical protein